MTHIFDLRLYVASRVRTENDLANLQVLHVLFGLPSNLNDGVCGKLVVILIRVADG